MERIIPSTDNYTIYEFRDKYSRPLETKSKEEKGHNILSNNLDEVIGLCRYCTKLLGDSPPPACAACIGLEAKRTTRIKDSDPYKKVWNTIEDEEAALLTWMKNGTLFVPTLEELAKRHMSAARHQLSKARKLGRSAEGIEAFNEALFQRKAAKDLLDKKREIVLKSR